MTKEEFIAKYTGKSGMRSKHFFDEHMLALPCECGDESCSGWAAVNNDPASIVNHVEWGGGVSGPEYKHAKAELHQKI